MAKKNDPGVEYLVVRDAWIPGVDGEQGRITAAGETVVLADEDAALLVRDGYLRTKGE